MTLTPKKNEPCLAELEARKKWLADYDKFAQGYSACRFINSFKGREVNNTKSTLIAINEFIQWHDRVCQVDKDVPLA